LAGRDQSQLYVHLKGIRTQEDEDHQRRCLAVISDITEQKRAEQALRESEQRFHGIFEQDPLGMTVVDRQYRFLDVNSKFCEILGYTRAELLNRSFSEITHPEDINQGEALAARLFRGELAHGQIEKRYLTKDNRLIWVRITATGIYDTAETPVYLLGMIEDITERQELHNRLEAERNLLRTLIDHLPDYIYVKDTESRFVMGNPAVAQVMGAGSVAELIGKTDSDFYPPALAAQYRADEEEIFRSGEPLINKQEPLVDPTGAEYVLSTTKVPLKDAQGNITGLVGIGRDITQRKQIEDEKTRLLKAIAQQREELRALAARLAEIQEIERQKLARELHDEIGQNLTALGFNLNFIQIQISTLATKPEMAGLIDAQLTDALALVEQTTDSIRKVMAELRPPVLDDYGLVDALEWYGRRFAKWTELTVTVWVEVIEPRLPAAVENALFRIAQEALTNVAKHAQASRAIVSIRTSDQSISLSVADDGIGFEPEQAAQARGRPNLGLLIMKERAEAVGGYYRIVSQPGQGTQVIVEVARWV
jgi:PAS domain S-box-containing protein